MQCFRAQQSAFNRIDAALYHTGELHNSWASFFRTVIEAHPFPIKRDKIQEETCYGMAWDN